MWAFYQCITWGSVWTGTFLSQHYTYCMTTGWHHGSSCTLSLPVPYSCSPLNYLTLHPQFISPSSLCHVEEPSAEKRHGKIQSPLVFWSPTVVVAMWTGQEQLSKQTSNRIIINTACPVTLKIVWTSQHNPYSSVHLVLSFTLLTLPLPPLTDISGSTPLLNHSRWLNMLHTCSMFEAKPVICLANC
jgi:hypothetical protein